MSRNIQLYWDDIENSIKKIKNYTRGVSLSDFSANEKTVDAVIRNLEIIGEAVKNLPREIKNQHPKVPWQEIIRTRNKIIHEYFGIDLEILWKTATEDIPELEQQISEIN